MALGTALFFSCFAITLRKFRKLDMLPTLLIAGLMVSWITLIMTYNFIKIPINEIFLCFIWEAFYQVLLIIYLFMQLGIYMHHQ